MNRVSMSKNMGNCLFYVIHVLAIFSSAGLKCNATESVVGIGVVLDLNSSSGSMADLCIKMALFDFYSTRPNYTTRLQVHTRNAESTLDANLAVIELVKHEEVHGIIWPREETENTFVAELGEKFHVPIISFTPRSSSLSHVGNHYFVRTATDDADQAKALAAICQGFTWTEVVVLYEDTDYGVRFLSHLNKALQDVGVKLAYMTAIPTSVNDSHLSKELKRLKINKKRVFLVHMNPSLGYRFFTLAKKVGVMSEGYAWIVSDSLSNFMNSMDPVAHDSMEGVLGVRPYVNRRSKELHNFQERWKRRMLLAETNSSISELNVYGLWVYDAVFGLAIAAEKIGAINSTSFYVNTTKHGTGFTSLRKSAFGSELLKELYRTRFIGLSGEFKQSTFEIFNVYGSGEKTIGFWTPDRGITREISSCGDRTCSTSVKELKNVIWPGDSISRPKGWPITANRTIRVGTPNKFGFREFVNLTIDPATNHITDAKGFAIDIFLATLKLLPHINYDFQHFNGNLSYDEILREIPEKFDMVVGDMTIWAPRTNYVDFSLPYSESGVILVVRNRKPFDMWIFIKPLRWDLWLAIIVTCILMGTVLCLLERRVAENGEERKDRPRNIILSPIQALAFPERNMVSNNWSFLVLLFWLFMAFIIMQSYTANLSAILTVDQLKFAFSDNYNVGYQEGTFMKQFLIDQLRISESRLRSCVSAEEYHHYMSLGSKNGGIDAIFDEIPYMKIFLKKYDPHYKMVGPTYRTGGFSFAFPIGSPLVSNFSKAIVEVTQGSGMTNIERINFGPGYSSQDPLSSTISQGASGLTLYQFAGLFLVIGSVTLLSLFCSETPIGRKLTETVSHFLHSRFNFRASKVDPVSGSDGGPGEGGVEEAEEAMDAHLTGEILVDSCDEIVQIDKSSAQQVPELNRELRNS